jgi:hypothetical protein
MYNSISSFDSFLSNFLFESSEIRKLGVPTPMVKLIHQKLEHWDKYPRRGHMYRGGVPVPLEYKYHRPAHDIEVEETITLTGRKSSTDPFGGKTIKSQYADIAWFINSLPTGEKRILLMNPELDFYMYIYNSTQSRGATGLQFAVIWWDPEAQEAVDFGFSELVINAADRSKIRGVHTDKGGNTTMKIQEFIRTATMKGRTYAPSSESPLTVHILKLKAGTKEEPKYTREVRRSAREVVTSEDLTMVFLARFKNIIEKASPDFIEKVKASLQKENMYSSSHSGLEWLNITANQLNTTPSKLVGSILSKMSQFRKELYKAGQGYTEGAPSKYNKTSGFELEKENEVASNYGVNWVNRYGVSKKEFAPDEERPEAISGEPRPSVPEKVKRKLPLPSEYASIPSMIKVHTLDGLLNKFMEFVVTGRVTGITPSLAGGLGIKVKDTKVELEPDKPTKGEVEQDDDIWLV